MEKLEKTVIEINGIKMEIEKKQYELDELLAKKEYLLKHFAKYFNEID